MKLAVSSPAVPRLMQSSKICLAAVLPGAAAQALRPGRAVEEEGAITLPVLDLDVVDFVPVVVGFEVATVEWVVEDVEYEEV